jgi:hypothetical protein
MEIGCRNRYRDRPTAWKEGVYHFHEVRGGKEQGIGNAGPGEFGAAQGAF